MAAPSNAQKAAGESPKIKDEGPQPLASDATPPPPFVDDPRAGPPLLEAMEPVGIRRVGWVCQLVEEGLPPAGKGTRSLCNPVIGVVPRFAGLRLPQSGLRACGAARLRQMAPQALKFKRSDCVQGRTPYTTPTVMGLQRAPALCPPEAKSPKPLTPPTPAPKTAPPPSSAQRPADRTPAPTGSHAATHPHHRPGSTYPTACQWSATPAPPRSDC